MLSYSFVTLFDRFSGGVSVMSYIEATCCVNIRQQLHDFRVLCQWADTTMPFSSSSRLAQILFFHQSAVFFNFVTSITLQLWQFENFQTQNDNLLKLILSYQFYKNILLLMLDQWSIFTIVCRGQKNGDSFTPSLAILDIGQGPQCCHDKVTFTALQ